MESPNKKSPSVWFNELRGLLTLIFQKVSKLVDRVLFDKKGSVIISLIIIIMIDTPASPTVFLIISSKIFHFIL